MKLNPVKKSPGLVRAIYIPSFVLSLRLEDFNQAVAF